MLKNYILTIFLFSIYTISINAQCAECPAGAIEITGTDGITDQNNANDYCITGDWTGPFVGAGNGSTITICPMGTWNMQNNITIQNDLQISNFGTITDNGNDYKFLVNNQGDLTNETSGVITVGDFENADALFDNQGSLTAEDIYLHGETTNSGSIISTSDCGGVASQTCGFYLGDKQASFSNTGTIEAVDAEIREGIVGGGTITVTGFANFLNNSAPTDNTFFLNDVSLQVSGTYDTGDFTISGTLDCNNANITSTFCFTDTGSTGSACSNNTVPIPQCVQLPVEVVSFTVKEANNRYVFNWEIAAEINVSHYELLYSLDGRKYLPYGKIEADKSFYYQWEGEKIAGEIVYFKLKNVDIDGSFAIYDKAILIEPKSSIDFSVSPNPASKDGFLYIAFEREENVLISLHDMNGRNLVSKYYNDEKSITFDIRSIEKSGLYVLQVSTATKSYTEEIFIH